MSTATDQHQPLVGELPSPGNEQGFFNALLERAREQMRSDAVLDRLRRDNEAQRRVRADARLWTGEAI